MTTLITVRASSPVLAISIFPFKNSFSLRVKHQEYLAVAGQDVDTEPYWCCLPKLTLSRVCSSVLSRRNLHKPRPQSFYHADVLYRSSTLVPAPRSTNDDEPLRTSAWEATVLRQGFLFSLFPKEGIGKREEPGEEVALSRRALMCTACEIKPGGGEGGGGEEGERHQVEFRA